MTTKIQVDNSLDRGKDVGVICALYQHSIRFSNILLKNIQNLGENKSIHKRKKNKFREKQKIRNYFKMCFFCLDCLVRKILNEIFISVSL